MYDTLRDAMIVPRRTTSTYARPYSLVTPDNGTCPYKSAWNLNSALGNNTLSLAPGGSPAMDQWLPTKTPRRSRKNTLRVNKNGKQLHGAER